MRYRLVAIYTVINGQKRTGSVDLLIKEAKRKAGRVVRKPAWPTYQQKLK